MRPERGYLKFAVPYFDRRELEAVNRVLLSGWWSRGKVTEEFEQSFARYSGAKYAVALSSCTAALHLGLLAAGVGPGDEVIVSPMTFCSTVNSILHTGAVPVFADIDPETGCLDPEEAEKKITPRTRAILPVHYGGALCRRDRFAALAREHRLFLLEDAAHAVGSRWEGEPLGAQGNFAFSFYATKNLAVGDGGMFTTCDPKLAARVRRLSLHGMDEGAWSRYEKGGSHRYDVTEPGFKCNMTDISAAIGLCQLQKLPWMERRREEIARCYDRIFAANSLLYPLGGREEGRSFHLYVVCLRPERLKVSRDEVCALLQEAGIGTSVHFRPVHEFSWYREHFPGVKMPQAEALYRRCISLPIYPSMNREDAEYVGDALCRIAEKHAK
ncbi:MAG: DegT/DnrJ/EryC1/StrS family aminotransferase [Oscillospiraceae bacterium]|nr:DegT/DnrJ/EryC1/StrS family aminotransferase [Oscillospiraceae bacterium]